MSSCRYSQSDRDLTLLPQTNIQSEHSELQSFVEHQGNVVDGQAELAFILRLVVNVCDVPMSDTIRMGCGFP